VGNFVICDLKISSICWDFKIFSVWVLASFFGIHIFLVMGF
jgi:hypothetical protein